MAGRTTTACLLPAVMALLFLLVGLVAADDVRLVNEEGGMGTTMRRALTTSTSASECAAELSACISDTSCTTCVTEFLSKEEECGLEAGTLCVDAQDFVCCTLADEEENCETDTTFGNFLKCAFEASNCGDYSLDVSDCNGATGLASSWGVSTVLGFTTVAGLLVATFGFVV